MEGAKETEMVHVVRIGVGGAIVGVIVAAILVGQEHRWVPASLIALIFAYGLGACIVGEAK